MALYTLADLHLAADVAKPMDIFGGRWQGHTEKIIKNCVRLLRRRTPLFWAGDISWGINLAEAKGDFCADRLAAGQKDHFERQPRSVVGNCLQNAPFLR